MIDLFVVMVSNFVYAAFPIFKQLLVVAVDGELLFGFEIVYDYYCTDFNWISLLFYSLPMYSCL